MDTIIISNSLPSYLSPPLHPNTTSTSQLHTTRFTPSNQRKSPSLLSLGPRNRTRDLLVRRFSTTCSAGRGGVTEIDETQFSDTVLKSDRPVLVEFVAKWCGPCRLIAPAMEWIAQEYKDKVTVVKIDHDANPKLIETYKVYGLPTFIIFKSGKEVPHSRKEGAITKVKLKDYLDAMLESISVA